MLEKQYKDVYDAIPCPILLVDEDLLIKEMNNAAAAYNLELELPGQIVRAFPWAIGELKQFMVSALEEIIIVQKEQGSAPGLWVEIHAKKLQPGKKGTPEILLILHDISDIKKAEMAIQHDQHLFFSIIEFLPDPTFVIDIHGRVIAWNRALSELTHIPSEDMLGKGNYEYALPFYGARRPMLIDYILKKIEQPALHYPKYHEDAGSVSAEIYLSSLRQEGIHLWAKATTLQNIDGEIIGAVETIRDITDLKKSEEQLQYISTHDPVTGLYNKPYFEAEIERLENSRRFPISVLFCDLQSVKKFSSGRKYPVNDQKVKEAAQILKACFRREDLVARLGAQEFGVLMPVSELSIGKKAVQRVIQSVVKFNQSKSKSDSLQFSIGLSTAIEPNALHNAVKTAQNRVSEANSVL